MEQYIDATWLLEIFITIIGILIARYIIPWIKKKTAESHNKELDFWLEFVCKAAEEKYKEVSGSGKLKFDYAKQLLEKQGFTYDAETIEALIDGKVRELFNWNDYRNIKVGGTN